MASYHLVGANISFPGRVEELDIFGVEDRDNLSSLPLSFTPPPTLPVRAKNWMEGEERELEALYSAAGVLLKTSGGSDFFILRGGLSISQINVNVIAQGRDVSPLRINNLDRSILLGPALILALALRSIWSFHASAVRLGGQTIVFLGESGQGKSTLAAYLSTSGWQRVADDILPVSCAADTILAWTHFPQLKLAPKEQPALNLPESLPLNKICLLTSAARESAPRLEKLSTGDVVKALLSHTAGTQIFDAVLLAQHLQFAAQVAKQIPAYRLVHPHRRDTLPLVREFLEKIC